MSVLSPLFIIPDPQPQCCSLETVIVSPEVHHLLSSTDVKVNSFISLFRKEPHSLILVLSLDISKVAPLKPPFTSFWTPYPGLAQNKDSQTWCKSVELDNLRL